MLERPLDRARGRLFEAASRRLKRRLVGMAADLI
jgi:hypothetical protein